MNPRALTPLHIPMPTATGVGTASTKMEVRGRLHDSQTVSGLAESIELTNTHSSQTLSISFNNNDWIVIAAGATRTFYTSCRHFWLKGSGADTTFSCVASIHGRFSA